MKDTHTIYWNLFWGLSTSRLNELIDREYKAGNFEGAKVYCKTLAIKETGISLDTFWDKYVMGKTKLKITLDEEAICQLCDGEGYVEVINESRLYGKEVIDVPYKKIICPECQGEGVIDE